MKTKRLLQILPVIAALTMTGCGKPGVSGLRDSFAEQLTAIRTVKDVQRQGDELSFTGPGVEGGTAKWRIHIESTVIEETGDTRAPYKGTVKSSWYENDKIVQISAGGRDSNLPVGLTETGLAQDCYALWDPAAKKWGW